MEPPPLNGPIIFSKEQVLSTTQLQMGDHIAVAITRIPGARIHHHGIYMGKDKYTGLDLVAEVMDSTGPRIVSMITFTNGGKKNPQRYNYISGSRTMEQVTLIAKSLADDPELWGDYCPLNQNCEHFATLCKTGNAYSVDVEREMKNALRYPTRLMRYIAAGVRMMLSGKSGINSDSSNCTNS